MSELSRDDMDARFERAGISALVRGAMMKVPREHFVLPEDRGRAYLNQPLGIGSEQTISQPLIVAHTTDLAEIWPGKKVLEIGTGSGYQTAVLLQMGAQVFSIERIQALAEKARKVLLGLNYENLELRWGDGFEGWPEEAPFDAIVLTAAPTVIPENLLNQLAEDGVLVGPEGADGEQMMVKITRHGNAFEKERLFPVVFVPMLEKTLTE